MAQHAKTRAIVDEIREVLEAYNPMTVRQVYYQLVAKQVLPNTSDSYQKVKRILTNARWDHAIPWGWIEDRLRQPRHVNMWGGLADFADTAKREYRRDVWATQPQYVEVWVEKDALSGIFEDVTKPYGVTLNVCRGYSSLSSLHHTAERYKERGKPITILYFGDHDPSGEDMPRALGATLRRFDCHAEIIKCALILEDIQRYNLPPDPAKTTDPRAAAYIVKNGDVSVELDALPIEILRDRIVSEVESRMDLEALANVREQEEADRALLVEKLARSA